MSLSVYLLESAEDDRDHIWTFTAERWGQDQATSYLRGLNDVLHLLAEFPEMAPLHREFSPPVRIRPYQSHLIVYQFDDTTLSVIRLLPARSDWTEVLAR